MKCTEFAVIYSIFQCTVELLEDLMVVSTEGSNPVLLQTMIRQFIANYSPSHDKALYCELLLEFQARSLA